MGLREDAVRAYYAQGEERERREKEACARARAEAAQRAAQLVKESMGVEAREDAVRGFAVVEGIVFFAHYEPDYANEPGISPWTLRVLLCAPELQLDSEELIGAYAVSDLAMLGQWFAQGYVPATIEESERCVDGLAHY